MKIRTMKSNDVGKVSDLAKQLGYENKPEEVRQRLELILKRQDHCVMVCEDDSNQIVGWIHLREILPLEKESYIEVSAIVVDQSVRGKGMGKFMMSWAEDLARQRGFCQVGLRTHVRRTDAHKFYERLGYNNNASSHFFLKNVSSAIA